MLHTAETTVGLLGCRAPPVSLSTASHPFCSVFCSQPMENQRAACVDLFQWRTILDLPGHDAGPKANSSSEHVTPEPGDTPPVLPGPVVTAQNPVVPAQNPVVPAQNPVIPSRDATCWLQRGCAATECTGDMYVPSATIRTTFAICAVCTGARKDPTCRKLLNVQRSNGACETWHCFLYS